MPAGDWTRALHIKCKEKQWIQGEKQRYNGADHEGDDVEMLGNNPYRLTVDINGPYGAPAQEYSKYNVLLLVVCPSDQIKYSAAVFHAKPNKLRRCEHLQLQAAALTNGSIVCEHAALNACLSCRLYLAMLARMSHGL